MINDQAITTGRACISIDLDRRYSDLSWLRDLCKNHRGFHPFVGSQADCQAGRTNRDVA